MRNVFFVFTAVLMFIAVQAADAMHVEAAFIELDENQDGFVTRAEWGQDMYYLKLLDSNADDRLSYEEFTDLDKANRVEEALDEEIVSIED